MLKQVDPKSIEKIHKNNVKRVIRALEYYHFTGEKFSVHNERESQRVSPYNFAYFVLTMNRQTLYNRIDTRIDQMMDAGLYDEVASLLNKGLDPSLVSMQGLGYKELLSYLDGECTLDDAVSQIKQSTRHFAKRQLTWFRREHEVIWVEKEKFSHDNGKILDFMKKELTERGIL